jgi:hypothetical protein
VINSNQLVNGITVACVFIVLGLVPGLCQQLADGLSNIAVRLRFRLPSFARPFERFEQPSWFALVGATLLGITILLYLWN